MLRITAHNNAGFNVAEYEFATLTMTGGESILYIYVFVLLNQLMLISYGVQTKYHA